MEEHRELLKKGVQSVGKIIKSLYDDILSKYIIPSNDILFLRDARTQTMSDLDALLNGIKGNQPTIEGDKKVVSVLMSLQENCLKYLRIIKAHCDHYYYRRYRYRFIGLKFPDDTSDLEMVTKVFDHMSSKRRNKLLKLRIKKLDPILEPTIEEQAKSLGFSGLQCHKCNLWRVEETSDGLLECIPCGHQSLKDDAITKKERIMIDSEKLFS
jgi:hypothetical protein